MSRTIDVRCPVCKDWYDARPDVVGTATTCQNCRQVVVMVPRSSRARMVRVCLKVLIVLGGVLLFSELYRHKEDATTKQLAPMDLNESASK